MTHKGKTAIVTGAAQGIGEAYAHGLAHTAWRLKFAPARFGSTNIAAAMRRFPLAA